MTTSLLLPFLDGEKLRPAAKCCEIYVKKNTHIKKYDCVKLMAL